MLVSSSGLTRVINCPESEWVFPKIDAGETVWSSRGTTTHEFMFRLISSGGDVAGALADVPLDDEARTLCECIGEHAASLPYGGQLEPAFAFDVFTKKARILGHNIGREYVERGLTAHELPGSADYVHVRGDTVIVLDWKTGWRNQKAKDSWQMRSLAVYAARVFGCSRAIVAHVYLREDQAPVYDEATFEMFELVAFERQLCELGQWLVANPSGVPERLAEGHWCRFCPGFRVCAAQTESIRHALAGLTGDAVLTEISNENVVGVILGVEKAEKTLARVWKELEKFAETHPIAMPDGRRLERAPGRPADQVIDAALALYITEQDLGEKASKKALMTSKGRLEEVAREWAIEAKQPIGTTQANLIEHLRRAGAIAKVPGKIEVRMTRGGGPPAVAAAPPAAALPAPAPALPAPPAQEPVASEEPAKKKRKKAGG